MQEGKKIKLCKKDIRFLVYENSNTNTLKIVKLIRDNKKCMNKKTKFHNRMDNNLI